MGFWFVNIVVVWLLSVVIFFFKQKTAYEMRISDWSSDMCSSDLPCELLYCGKNDDSIGIGVLIRKRPCPGSRGAEKPIQPIKHTLGGFGAKGEKTWEIGRASCRERVCQYV